MRNPQRIKRISKLLEECWELEPDWRLCQFISNLHGVGRQDIFHTEDDELEKVLLAFKKSYGKENNNVCNR